jgi:hypothetical protein
MEVSLYSLEKLIEIFQKLLWYRSDAEQIFKQTESIFFPKIKISYFFFVVEILLRSNDDDEKVLDRNSSLFQAITENPFIQLAMNNPKIFFGRFLINKNIAFSYTSII